MRTRLNTVIPTILLRFREDEFTAKADIQEAFLQISAKKEVRDFLTFFWWINEIGTESPIENPIRHYREVFGLKSSLFLLLGITEFH